MAGKAAQNSTSLPRPEKVDAEGQLAAIAARLIAAGDITIEQSQADDFSVHDVVVQLLIDKDAENATLRRQLAAQKGQTTQARNRLQATIEDFKPRKIGPIDHGDDDSGYSAAELWELALAAGTVEIAFSDGTNEIAPPLKLDSGQDLVPMRGALRLRAKSAIIHGPAHGEPSRMIAGWALVLDGEPVVYASRYEPLRVAAGQQVEMVGEIVF